LVVWAAVSSLWSPTHPKLDDSVAVKLPLELLLFWAAVCGARRAEPKVARLALRVLAWGLAAYGVVLLAEAFTHAGIYRAIRAAIGDPTSPDLAGKNVAQGTFVLAVLWPAATAAGMRAGAPGWLGVPMALGCAAAAHVLLADAPVLAVGAAMLVAGLVGVWPSAAPKGLGLAAALAIILMPLVAWAIHASGIVAHLPLSWAQRVGYWGAVIQLMTEHPLRGWGLDASRSFTPAIQLHPHNGALQIWLELGLLGAVLAALVWAVVFRAGVARERSLLAPAAAATSAVYLLIGLVSFGVWQEWWLAVAGLAAAVVAAGARATRAPA
jgi:O-antigen ligase